MYADAMQEGKRFPQSEVHKYAEWILTKCDKPKDEMTWLIQTILESNNAHCLDDIFDTMLHE